jgi:hypothetical protein
MMEKFLWAIVLVAGCAVTDGVLAQDATPAAAPAASPATAASLSVDAGTRPTALLTDGPPPPIAAGKVGLVRGVLKRMDPIHDQLLIHAFGGGDVRIAFDPRTQLLAENASTGLIGLPVGSVVSVDTVIDDGKLFARSVRTGTFNPVDLNGQVVRYDASKSLLTIHDPMSPKNVVLRIAPGTVVVNRGQPAAVETLSPGMLVQVWFSTSQNASKHGSSNVASSIASDTANKIEILAERGNSFVFAGRIVAVDLRSGILALSNDTDQSIRELAINSLDTDSLRLLQEGTKVTIQAEFDGERYKARSVTVVAHNP